MILVVDALHYDQFSDVLDEVFHLQTRLFGPDAKHRFGGPSAPRAGPSDAQRQTYLVGLNHVGKVVSFSKFPQTAQRLAPKLGAPSPPFVIAEAVQLCLDIQHFGAGTSARLEATVMLMIAVLEYAQTAGIDAITTVIDPYISRILKQFRTLPHDPMGRVTAMTAAVQCHAGRIAALRAYAGIGGDVFISAAAARALRDARARQTADHFAHGVLPREIALYCAQQLAAARTDKERAAAHRLLHHLIEKGLHPLPQH